MRRREFIAGLGAAAAWPLAARAQQPSVPVIGYLSSLAAEGDHEAFRRGLREQGYDVEILERYALESDRLPGLAADMVRRRATILAALGTATPALAATVPVPIVFVTGTDPVELGLVQSFNRPGGNITGVTFRAVELIGKRLELLREIVPAVKLIGFLDDPTPTPFSLSMKAELNGAEIAARALGLRLVIEQAATSSEIERAFVIFLEQRVGAFVTTNRSLFYGQAGQLAALAARHAIPAIYPLRDFVDAGGLMSYGGSVSDAVHIAGSYVGRILKGEKPADLPVQQSTRIEMVLNLKTAKTLGITFPTTLLVRADEVIE